MFYTWLINFCKHEANYQIFVENNTVFKYKIMEKLKSQTCIKMSVQVIIEAPE